MRIIPVMLCGSMIYLYSYVACLILDNFKTNQEMDAMVECIDHFVKKHSVCESKRITPEVVTEYKSWVI